MIDFSKFDTCLLEGSNTPNNPKVSICLITYNHNKFIRECLDSLLSQETNFEYEIIIGDDCSNDGTDKTIKEYAIKFPNKIKAFVRNQNISGILNYLHVFYASKGQYVMNMEGDDYLTNTNKLQIQADFLDQNLEYSACFHNALVKYEDNSGRENHNINPPNQKKSINTVDFLIEKETWFMGTATVLMRKKFVESLPNWFHKCKSADIPLYFILTEKAPIAYIDKIMSVYRRHLGGLSYTDDTKTIKFLANRIFMYSSLNKFTKYRYNDKFRSILGEYYLLYLNTNDLKNKWFTKLYYFFKAYLLLPKSSSKILKDSFKESLMTNFIKRIIKIYLIFR